MIFFVTSLQIRSSGGHVLKQQTMTFSKFFSQLNFSKIQSVVGSYLNCGGDS